MENFSEASTEWSVCSDFYEYLSPAICRQVRNVYREAVQGARRREIVFSAGHRRVVTRIDALRRRQLLLAAFNRQESRETCLELIKYYNKNGFLNDPLQFKFINSLVKNNIKYYVNRLKFSDINNIRNNKYNRLSILIKLAAAVRNKQRLRQVRESQNIYKLRKLINKINNNYVNKFLQLDVEEGIDQAEEMYPDDEDITPSVSRRVRVQIWDDVTQFDLPRVYQETTIPERNIDLLQKLHIILWRFRNSRRRAALREEIEMQFPLQTRQRMADIQDVQPEMIEPTEIGQQQESGPVVLTALEQDRNTETTQDLDDGFWVNNSTGDAIVNQQHASSMEILTYQFNWSSSQQSNYKLFDIGLPIYAITNNPDHPAAMLFNQYAYWNGDIKIRIHINTTPFHIGKLIFSWYYAGDFDANQSHRDNIASSILLPNVCFSASKGDDVVLEIPYRNYRSMLCTRNDSATDSKPLYLGNLRCYVFNPLILGDATSVDGYIHVSFVNNKFTGISPRVVVQPEMLPTRSLIKGIEKSLNIVDKITNMDKPPNPAVPTMYTPQLTDSFASGTNDFNNIHALRLNPAGQTPHPRGSSTTVEETLVDNIIQKPGLLRILKWETSSTRGHKLMQLDVSPELNYSDYYSTIIHQNTIDYSSVVLPPVSAVSCFNAYNRGGIKYTIEVICSRYHAGALLVSFTPRARNIDLNTAVKSYNATLDIGNIQSYEFIAPYINERPYNPRFNRELSNVVLPALAPVGEFNIFVLNQLRSINDVSKTVYVNVYMSAANDFEVAVPVPPLYSVDYDYQVPIKPQTLYLDNMSSDMGVDDWRYFDKSRHLCVFKYGTGSDSVAQLVGAQPYTVYQIKPKGSLSIQDSPYSVRQWVVAQGVFSQTVNFNFTAQYFAVIIVNGDGNKYRYLAPFSSLDVARSYCIAHHSLRTAGNLYPDSPTLEQWVAYLPTQTSFYLCLNNNNEASYRAPSNTGLTNYPFVSSSVAAEMDNVILDPTIKRLPSAQKGLRLFGEQFSDLKDYCRRYQIYGSATVKTDKNTLGFRVRVPITPIGLTLDKDSNGVVHSITREGIIGYIASAFRFYRGSMRFKIIATIHAATSGERSNQHNTWYIQHKPDVMLSNRNINVLYYNSNSTPSPYNVLQSGYAYTAFSPHINNSITFETPCYIPTNLLMLQKPNFDALAETLHYTLGCFDIYGYTNLDAMTIEFTLHYALGDDMDMSCYVGFPPMIPLYSLQASDNEFVHVQPEMDEVKKKLDEDEKQSKENELATTSSEAAVDAMLAQAFSNLAQGKTSVVESHGVHLVLEPPKHMKPDKVQSEGWFDWPKKKWDEFKINYGMKEMRKKFELPPASNDTVYNLIKDLSIKFGSTYKDLIISIVSQLLHCIINSSVSTFALAIVTILTHLGLRSTTVMDKITSCFARMFSSVQGEMDDDKTEKSSEDECKQSFTMTIVSLGMSLFDKTWDFFKNMTMPDFTKGLFQNIRMGALTITAVITMFKNLVTVVPKIIQWIGRVVNPVAWYRWFVSDKKDFILKWVSDAEWATDPANLETVRSDMHYAYELELLVIVGRDISLKLNQMDKLKYDGKYISSLFARLIQVHQQVVANFHCISGVGVEPYCFRLVGGSQVGKSYCTKELMLHCLDSVGYKTHGNLIYERSKTKHFDGLSGIEPGLYYDDFLHLTTPEMASEQIAELLTLKSKCVFIPPRAELSDKGKPFNPLIVAASMNVEFPDFKNICADPFAWMNRFDDLIRVSFKPPQGYQDKVDCSEIPHEVLQRFEHVTFQVLDRRNNAVTPGVKRVEVPDVEPTATPEQVEKAKLVTLANLNFVQLKWYLAKRFQQRMANVSKDCLRDLQLVNRFRPQKDSDFQTNLDEYIKFIRERNKQLNEQEHATIKLIESIKGLEKCSKCHNHLLLCICRYTHGVSFGQLSGPVQPEMGETYDFAAIVKKAKIDFSKYSYIDAALLRVRFFEVLAKNRDEPVRVKLWMSSFTTFINEPCIHRYVKLMKHYYFPNLEYDSCLKLFQFVTLEGEHFSLISCDSKCAVRKDPDYIDYMRKVFVSQFDEAFIPEEYKVNDPKLKEHIVEFKKRQKTAHAKFCKFLAEEVDPDTWMTKKGSLLWKICKYSLVVIGAVGVLYGVCNYKSVIKQVQKLNPYNSIKNQNVAYAKMLEEHVVTETCLNGQCQICINPQMAYDQNKKNTKPRLNITSKTIESKSIQPEMNTEFFNSLSRHLKRNYFYLFAHDGNYESVARCLGVKGRWFLAIDHYFDKFDTMSENAKFYYCDQQMYKPIDYKSIVKYKLKNSAIVMCKLPNDMPLFKNIVKRFVRSDFVHNVCPTAYLYEPVIPNSDKMVGTMDIMLHKNVLTLVDDTLCIPDINGAIDKYTTCEWYWQYQTSGKGRCGSILISDMNHNSPIVGMHVAGKPGSSGQAGSVGYGEVICQETLENVLEQLEPSMILVDIETEGQMFDGKYINIDVDKPERVKSALDGNFIFTGVVPEKFSHKPPTKSKLVHTMCYNQITNSTYDFPHISHRDSRFEGSPMVNGCLHHTDPPLSFKTDLLEVVQDDVKQQVLAKVKPIRSKVGVLTREQSICGIHEVPQYGAMEFDTSEGFPFVSIRPKTAKDKRWLFDLYETSMGYGLRSIDKRLVEVMDIKQQQREKGIVPLTIFTDCLKDAKLPAEKCHKTRIFSISPVDFTIQFRQYFYDFTIAFQEARFSIESAVGINVDSYEWNEMVRILLSNSTKFVCGDYSKFGPRLMSSVVVRFFEIICDWYEAYGDSDLTNRRVRMAMAHEIAFAQHLMLNMVYQVLCGAPSGCPITTILNNGVNMMYLRSAYLQLSRENNIGLTLESYKNNVCSIFYGDDLIMTVKEDILYWFNAPNISSFFDRYNIKFTDALKTGDINLYTTVFAPETSFLKRCIKRHAKRPVYVAAMDKRAIEETCNWTFASNDLLNSSLISCESMLLNAHGQGKEYYEMLRNKCMQYWRQFGICPSIPSWVDVDWRIYEGLKPIKRDEDFDIIGS